VFRSKVGVFTVSIQWTLEASKTSIPLFFRRALGLLYQTSVSHSTISYSVTHPCSLPLNIIPLWSLASRRFFLFRIMNGGSCLTSTRTESITVFSGFHVLLFWQVLTLILLHQLQGWWAWGWYATNFARHCVGSFYMNGSNKNLNLHNA
jgi:hypothetical protein